ncbi:alpha/beta fold hydrolase [Silanimonas lenta]|uniref:alpha/beta fold hydrolase n=1 Tax=Silanimonas lenta TaxID=265429 RepID=UPI0004199B38|nr:alpha/beta hydrolase [Silanimonas lenta]
MPPDGSDPGFFELGHWREGGEHIPTPLGRLFVRRQTEPRLPVLLLLHGFPSASWDWAPLWEPLSKHFSLLALDFLGFGDSAKPKRHRYTIIEQAELCEWLLRREGAWDYHVLAHDYGDTVAQELLARQLDRRKPRPQLRSVLFLNGGIFPEAHRPRPIQRLLATPLLGPLLARLSTRRRFAASLRSVFGPDTPPDPRLVDGLWQLLETEDGRRVLPDLSGYLKERRQLRARWVGALERVAVPMALVNGSADPVSGAHAAQRWRELLGEDDLVELPGIGHYPHVEAPAQVLEAGLRFWRRHRVLG